MRDLERLAGPVRARPANHRSLTRRTSRDTGGDVSRVLGKLETTGQNYTILQLLANASVLFRPFILLSDALNNRSAISSEIRETVILALAAQAETQYEWAEHVPMARRAGLTERQIAALADRITPAGPVFGPDQLLALSVVRELGEDHRLESETWDRITDRWGPEGAIELVAIVGWWGGFVPTMIAALGLVQPDDGRPGLRLRA